MEGGELVGEHTVFVHQETEASLLLQQSLFAAVCDEQIYVHLTIRQCFQALRKKIKLHFYHSWQIIEITETTQG